MNLSEDEYISNIVVDDSLSIFLYILNGRTYAHAHTHTQCTMDNAKNKMKSIRRFEALPTASNTEMIEHKEHSLGLAYAARIVPAAVFLLAFVDRHDRRNFLQKEIVRREADKCSEQSVGREWGKSDRGAKSGCLCKEHTHTHTHTCRGLYLHLCQE